MAVSQKILVFQKSSGWAVFNGFHDIDPQRFPFLGAGRPEEI